MLSPLKTRLCISVLSALALGTGPGARAATPDATQLSVPQAYFPASTPAISGAATDTATNATLAQWNVLRRNSALPFSSYASFLLANRNWPNEAQFRRDAERALKPGLDSPMLVVSFFQTLPPQNPTAMLRYAEALDALGRRTEATNMARNSWTAGLVSPDEEARLMARFAPAIRPEDQDARMDQLLWQRQTAAAARQLTATSPARRPTFDVRLALLTKAADAPDRLAYATSDVRNDPGFIADYMWWLRSTGQAGIARQILRQNMPMASYPAAADVWIQTLLISAKDAAKDNEWQIAYDIASRANSGYPPGTIVRDRPFEERDAYTDLTWLGAMAAFQRLNQPADAARLFTLYAQAAKSPQTQARGWYWAGRAYKSAGQNAAAQTAFETAARFADQFHGQLATEQLGRTPDVAHDSIELAVSPQDRSAFFNRSVVRAMLALGRSGNWTEQSLFVRSIANAVSTDVEHVLAAELAVQSGRPDLNVLVGRNARNSGLSGYMRTAFPKIDVPPDLMQSWTMIHAIARQESQFDRAAMSPVGARGLMQLMPATARDTARRAGVAFNPAQLTDPIYNVTLGSTFFGRLMDVYGGSYVLAVAAYNAGPGNVNRWIQAYGDPRGSTDVLTWIDSIPFAETRNYVQRVLENAVVYDLLEPGRANVKSRTPLSTYLGKRYPG
ncbi:MAG: transglycosylase SLT domain-containing protein [Chakrabartia sp.]